MSSKFTQPRAAVPFCWLCDRALYAGGRSYVTITDEDGHTHPSHHYCAQRTADPNPGNDEITEETDWGWTPGDS